MCSGYLAGRSAASEVGAVPDLDGLEVEIEAERTRIAAPLAPRGDALPQAMFEASIRQVMSYYMGFEIKCFVFCFRETFSFHFAFQSKENRVQSFSLFVLTDL